MNTTLLAAESSILTDRISPEMPLLHLFSRHPVLAAAQPLRGVHAISTLHALPNLRSTLIAMERLGLVPEHTRLFFKSYQYPAKAETLAWAEERGYRVAPVESLDAEMLTQIAEELPEDARLLLAEDGGHAFTAICRHAPELLPRIIGVVEQTTKGIRRINHAVDAIGGELNLPVLSLPDSTVKRNIEPPHIARGVIRSIEAVLDESLSGLHRVAVLGCGVIGLQIASQLASQGCRIRVYDPKPCLCGEMSGRFDLAETAALAVDGARIVIGTSGERAITESVINRLAHRSIVVSASSDRVELDFAYLNQLATEKTPFLHPNQRTVIGTNYRLAHNDHKITLLADGMPINFLGLGGMNDRVADCILTEILVACALVADGRYAGQRGVLTEAFNEIDLEFGISRRFFEFQRAL